MFEVQFNQGDAPIPFGVPIPSDFRFPYRTDQFNSYSAETVFQMEVFKVVVGADGDPKVGV